MNISRMSLIGGVCLLCTALTGCTQQAAQPTPTPTPRVVDVRVGIPEEFTKEEVEGFTFYYAASDGSSISLNTQAKSPLEDTTFQEVTQEMLHNTLVEGFESNYGMQVEITDHAFTRETIDSYPAYQYTFGYTLNDIPVEQIIVSINADQIYTLTYTDTTGEWMDTFQSTIAQIELVLEEAPAPGSSASPAPSASSAPDGSAAPEESAEPSQQPSEQPSEEPSE